MSGGRDTDADRFFDRQEKRAWVLHPPILIGHNEIRVRLDLVPGLFHRHRQCEVVVGAVDTKHPLYLYGRCPVFCEPPVTCLGTNVMSG